MAFMPGCRSQKQDPVRADGPGAAQCRITDATSSADSRATFTPWTGTAEALTTEVPAAERSGQGAGEQAPEGARGRPSRALSQGRKRPEAGSRPPGPGPPLRFCSKVSGDTTGNRAASAGRPGRSRSAAPPRGCSWPPALRPGWAARGEPRATAALHGRGTGVREQPLAAGWKMQGRSPQPSMELNSECVAKRGDGSEQEGALHWQRATPEHPPHGHPER